MLVYLKDGSDWIVLFAATLRMREILQIKLGISPSHIDTGPTRPSTGPI